MARRGEARPGACVQPPHPPAPASGRGRRAAFPLRQPCPRLPRPPSRPRPAAPAAPPSCRARLRARRAPFLPQPTRPRPAAHAAPHSCRSQRVRVLLLMSRPPSRPRPATARLHVARVACPRARPSGCELRRMRTTVGSSRSTADANCGRCRGRGVAADGGGRAARGGGGSRRGDPESVERCGAGALERGGAQAPKLGGERGGAQAPKLRGKQGGAQAPKLGGERREARNPESGERDGAWAASGVEQGQTLAMDPSFVSAAGKGEKGKKEYPL
nr:translation initiation factor IF-2-like [Aegilops tauschii subsp. strangulata]